MDKKHDDQRWALTNSTENTLQQLHQIEEAEQEEDETLSLSDLPLIHKENTDNNFSHNETQKQIQDDFDFCSLSKQPEMCAADELFFQGQILPFRHSVSSEKGSLLQFYKTRSVSRSESMDLIHSGSGVLISSRSSSISSHHSSSSGSSAGPNSRRPKLPPARNQFHSHPSPSPKIHFPTKNYRNYNSAKKSTVWSVFKLGVLTPPPEIAFKDLKQRSNCRNFGSRNSTDSNSSSMSSGYKKKNRSLLGGCKCSADAVDTVPNRVVIMKRSASESEMDALQRESMIKMPIKKKAAKKQLSHRRTFEWLKQLSLEDAAD